MKRKAMDEENLMWSFWNHHVEDDPLQKKMDPRIAGIFATKRGSSSLSKEQKPLAPRAAKRSRELSKAEVSNSSQLRKLFEEADKKEVAAFFKLGAIERLSPGDQEKFRGQAIGSRPVRNIKNEKEVAADPSVDPIAKTR